MLASFCVYMYMYTCVCTYIAHSHAHTLRMLASFCVYMYMYTCVCTYIAHSHAHTLRMLASCFRCAGRSKCAISIIACFDSSWSPSGSTCHHSRTKQTLIFIFSHTLTTQTYSGCACFHFLHTRIQFCVYQGEKKGPPWRQSFAEKWRWDACITWNQC
jgi:hypothetical protein